MDIDERPFFFNYIELFFIILLLILFFFLGFQVCVEKYHLFNLNLSNSPMTVNSTNCYVPSPEETNNFCKNQGYHNGWVSQTCGANEVQCHKKVGDMDKFVCVSWIEAVN